VVSARQHARVLGYVEAGVAGGARLVSGGDRPAGDAFGQGFYVNPTVFCDVADDMRIAREEIFGPVLAIFPFDSEDEVVRRANDTPFGLGAGMWTRDVGRAHRVGGALKAGSVWVNCYNALDPAVPSGGYKASGWGREYGPNHLEEHLNVKSLWIQT
jgi:aldehyde dehydrogenase (NAD+)